MIDKLDKKFCTGCTSCASICPKKCISMIKDEEGFNYPIIDESICILCNLCEKVCPVINKLQVNDTTQAYAAINLNEETRINSTSGGIFSILSEYILANNGYVVGAAYDDNYTVKHIIINDKKDLYKLRGAKYSQSELGNILIEVKQLLEDDHWVLFSGTPCQVGGLKAFLNKDYDKLVTVDLICHGVPSPMVWSKYLDYRLKEDQQDKIHNINLRSKVTGWSNYNYSIVFDYKDSQYQSVNYNDLYMKSFVGNICLRPSCSNCSFKGIQRVSDFTLGDYWGVWDQLPEMDDNKGTSLVFIHTKIGKEIFEYLSDKIKYIEVDPKKSIEMNGSMTNSSPKHNNRETFFDKVDIIGFDEATISCLKSVRKKNESFVKKVVKRLTNRIMR